MEVLIKKLTKDAIMPAYKTDGAAGMDVCSVEQRIIQPHHWTVVNTGLSVEVPKGYEVQVRPRSGLAKNHGITVLNSPGTIDSDYRGEIGVILINHSDAQFEVNPGDRIAQLVFAKYEQVELMEADELSETERGNGGFGHTGTKESAA